MSASQLFPRKIDGIDDRRESQDPRKHVAPDAGRISVFAQSAHAVVGLPVAPPETRGPVLLTQLCVM